MKRVNVAVAPRSYDVVVGPGALAELAAVVGARRRVAVVTQPDVLRHHGEGVARALPDSEIIEMGDGETAKTLATVEALCRRFAAAGLLRADAVVALGGGVVGDTAGFAAAVYHRGIDVVQAPTTLLGQVDAAIGGKTAVNLPEGKNLVGAFHQPLAVLADVDTLATLPEREYSAGLGEVAKYALMGDEPLTMLLRDRAGDVLARDPGVLTELVGRCAGIKAATVAADPEERAGRRATLNYGHTLAHALETVGGYDVLHGEAVAIGLVFAAALAAATERVDAGHVDAHRALLDGLGLPTRAPDSATADALLTVMQRDKKARGGLTFVLRDRDGGLGTVDDPSPTALANAFAAVGVRG